MGLWWLLSCCVVRLLWGGVVFAISFHHKLFSFTVFIAFRISLISKGRPKHRQYLEMVGSQCYSSLPATSLLHKSLGLSWKQLPWCERESCSWLCGHANQIPIPRLWPLLTNWGIRLPWTWPWKLWNAWDMPKDFSTASWKKNSSSIHICQDLMISWKLENKTEWIQSIFCWILWFWMWHVAQGEAAISAKPQYSLQFALSTRQQTWHSQKIEDAPLESCNVSNVTIEESKISACLCWLSRWGWKGQDYWILQ